MVHQLLGVDERFLRVIVCVGPNVRVHVHIGCWCPVWFRRVADIAHTKDLQISVKHPDYNGAVVQDAYGLVRGILLYRGER